MADLTVKIGPGAYIHEKCVETICKNRIQCIDNNTKTVVRKILKKKIMDEEVIITKADKGNTVVLMKRASYDDKVMDILDKMGAHRNEEFDFPAHVKEMRKMINGSNYLVKNHNTKRSLLVPNLVPPPPIWLA